MEYRPNRRPSIIGAQFMCAFRAKIASFISPWAETAGIAGAPKAPQRSQHRRRAPNMALSAMSGKGYFTGNLVGPASILLSWSV